MDIEKLVKAEKFGDWFKKINSIIEILNKATNDILGKADKTHTSTTTDYGIGSETEYGHVKISDKLDNTSNKTNGVAATPFAVKQVYDLATQAMDLASSNKILNDKQESSINNILTTVNSKAPTQHSSSNTTYGIGNAQEYGHVKLSVALDSEADTTSGVAVAPIALKTVNDTVINLSNEVADKAKTYHASEKTIYGVGNAQEYGHLKITDDLTLNNMAIDGIVPSVGSVKVISDLAYQADVNATKALSMSNSIVPVDHAVSNTTYGIGNRDNYGHVKLTDDISIDSADSGIAVSPYALKSINDVVEELKSKINDATQSGSLSIAMNINDVDLNTITAYGSYISNIASSSLHYPYDNNSISVLKVVSATNTVKQMLYSNSSLYIRNSSDTGTTWSSWVNILQGDTSMNDVYVYVSPQFGDDNKSGTTPSEPIQSWNRLFEIINSQSNISYTEENKPNITVFFDRGSYSNIPPLSNIPLSIKFSPFYYTTISGEEILVELEENRPQFKELIIINSRISLSGLRVDKLEAHENSTVVIESDDYFSINNMLSNTGSIIYLSSLYIENYEDEIPMLLHSIKSVDPESGIGAEIPTPIFTAENYGTIYDVHGRILYIKEAIKKDYIFDVETNGKIDLRNNIFEVETGGITATQYKLISNGSLYHPNIMLGNPANNIRETNTILQGVLWGGGSTAQYLRADGTWETPPDTTYTASNGIKLTGTNFTNTGVTSFNGETGAVTYFAPVTSVNGQTGAVTIDTSSSIKSYVTETWVEGTSGYRLFSDGFIEQWGRTGPLTDSTTTITFYKEFKNTNYVLISTAVNSGWRVNTYSSSHTERTAIIGAGAINGGGTGNISWYACGY